MKKTVDTLFKQSLTHILTYQDSVARLNKDMRIFESKVGDKIAKSSPVISSKVEMLIELSRKFIKLCIANPEEKFVPFCLAAVDYLVTEIDAIEDFQDYDGFDDDEHVFKKIILDFNLDDRLKKISIK